MLIVRFCLMLAFAALPAASLADPAAAVSAQGRVWVLDDVKGLSSLDPATLTPRAEITPAKATGLCGKPGGALWLLSTENGRWTLWRRDGLAWAHVSDIDSGGETLMGLACDGPAPVLLSERRLVRFPGGRPVEVSLSEPMPRNSLGVATFVRQFAGRLYVAWNRGEWGGGFRRIDARTGAVLPIEPKAGGLPCGESRIECSALNAIEAEPWNPACLVAAEGAVHFMSHGRLWEICGDTVRRLFFAPVKRDMFGQPPKTQPGHDEPDETVAFYSLQAAGAALWAGSGEGLYRLDARGVAAPLSWPERFPDLGDGLHGAVVAPRLLVLLTEVHRRNSVSGSTPLMVGF